MADVENLIKQALAMANNFIFTGRTNEAIKLLSQINTVHQGNATSHLLMEWIATGVLTNKNQESQEAIFGKNWTGQDLSGKSIHIICDQGIGDTINCLRYLHQMKQKWNCRIVLNCHAFYKEFRRLMDHAPYVDDFVEYACYCNYHTNILSVPSILNGLVYDVYYPARWQNLLETTIPDQPYFDNIEPYRFAELGFRVGVVWESNVDNPISKKKSLSIHHISLLEDGVNELWSLSPSAKKCNIAVRPEINDLQDTASFILGMDVVVTVDTATLHLAGTLNKKTLALLPYNADSRWALDDTTIWYPSVEIYRQPENLDWEVPIRQVKKRLESLRCL